MSYKEIATVNGVRESTVNATLDHARQRLPEAARRRLAWLVEEALDRSDPP